MGRPILELDSIGSIPFQNGTSQNGYDYNYVIVTYKSESNSGLGCPKPDRYTTTMISQKDIPVWDTFYIWMDGDPIPNRNFPNGIGRLPVQFWNWIDSGMGRNIYTTNNLVFFFPSRFSLYLIIIIEKADRIATIAYFKKLNIKMSSQNTIQETQNSTASSTTNSTTYHSAAGVYC